MGDLSLDPSVPAHAAALDRLETREIAWLGSTGRDGYPHSVPVWFVWHDGAAVVFSQPHAAKARNLRADPRASLVLETAAHGEEWVLLQGTVEFSPEPASAWLERFADVYLAKYGDGLAFLGWTPERITGDYSLVLLFHPQRIIA
ncbi:pyridoxamine 5'-phosphate oxidase family protein [Microbacterium ulmi]|uniref:Pyridoxamine 5'-phosphate oxidase N-terminal domain-containing protein n=1 Tax=Microbacterium ulmi TaxID=179095 RepID=A0A7Y2Q1J2_9MICO|nr:PPOX class probable F420-dependent enzyme [Microbacterium ulmi]NNH03985.1 hypothetical protein [Microbacterium ulmi]